MNHRRRVDGITDREWRERRFWGKDQQFGFCHVKWLMRYPRGDIRESGWGESCSQSSLSSSHKRHYSSAMLYYNVMYPYYLLLHYAFTNSRIPHLPQSGKRIIKFTSIFQMCLCRVEWNCTQPIRAWILTLIGLAFHCLYWWARSCLRPGYLKIHTICANNYDNSCYPCWEGRHLTSFLLLYVSCVPRITIIMHIMHVHIKKYIYSNI